MKRLLCLLSGMNAGGAETFLMKMYRRLDKTEYQMDFCVNTDLNCFYADEIKKLGGKLYRIPSKSESVKEFKKQLTDVIKNGEYKYVLRIASNAAGFMDLKIAHRAGAKICSARSSNSSDGGSLKTVIAHRIGRILYGKYVDVKIAPSDLAAVYTFGRKADVHMLHNAIDSDVFKYDESARLKIREEFGIDGGMTVVGHIGRFMTQKNHGFLLEIFAEYLKSNPDSVLMLVGKGELEEQIRKKAEELGITDKIIFTGVRSDIPQILSAMDIFVFPSLYEGMPNTVIEAQATGLPCLISDTVTREADITGLVKYLPLGNVDAWVDAINNTKTNCRKDTRQDFIDNKYDIASACNEFTRLVFGE